MKAYHIRPSSPNQSSYFPNFLGPLSLRGPWNRPSFPPPYGAPAQSTPKTFLKRIVILLETVEQEIAKFKDCNSLLDINSLFTEAKIYHNKLVNIRKEMLVLHERTTKLKKRALKLQQQKQRDALEKEQQHEKELERERQLTAKPAKRT
uniref:Biogenesis of lysosomal organelles complex-1, subunit 6, pallidin n=1 Tax=Paramormyrops kingsleyae TaxID=1676925 RepID=A0A3B3Q1Z8_9TELE